MTRFLRSVVSFRGLVLAVAAVAVVAGFVQVRDARRDVLPEFGPPVVEVQTGALGLAAEEVEQLITVPLEQDLLNGVAFLDSISSRSVTGLSSIVLVFEPGTPLVRARQVVNERLTQAAGLPNVSKPPQMLQPLSSERRVMMIGLSSSRRSLIELGVLARWTIRPRLMGVPGVANVAIWGQRERQLQVLVDPAKLRDEGIPLEDVIATAGNALWASPLTFLEASTPGTGGFVDGPNQRLSVQHVSPIKTPEDLGRVVIERSTTDGSEPALRLGDVAEVVEDHQPLIGDAIVASGPGLVLVIEKAPNANVKDVTEGVERALADLKPGLTGVDVEPALFRAASYVDAASDNVGIGLLVGLGALVVLAGLLLFDWRVAVMVGVAAVTSMTVAVLVITLSGASLNALTVGGILLAIPIVAADAVGDADVITRRVGRLQVMEGGPSRVDAVVDEHVAERRPLAFATAVIGLTLLPAYFVHGELGEFLPRLLLAFGATVLAAMLVSLFVAPSLGVVLLRGRERGRRGAPFAEWVRSHHRRALAAFARSPGPALAVLGVVVVVGVVAAPFLERGRSFVPELRDRDLMIAVDAAPGTSLTEMVRITGRVAHELRSLSGIDRVGVHVGRAVLGDQVVGSNSGEIWVTIGSHADYHATRARVAAVARGYPGLATKVVTYANERVDEVLDAPRRDLTVHVFGEDLSVLRDRAERIETLLGKVDGVVRPRVSLTAEEPTLVVRVDLAAAQRAGISPGEIRRAATTLVSGLDVGSLFEEQKVFDVTVQGTPATRNSLTSVRELVIATPRGGYLRLGDLAAVSIAPSPVAIEHADVSRYVAVTADVSGRSKGAVRKDVEARLEGVTFPFEYHAEVVDVPDRLGTRNLGVGVVEVSIAVAIGVVLLIQACLGRWLLALMAAAVMLASLAGGVLALLVDGGRLSIGAIAGFFAVFAVAARATLLLVALGQDGAGEAEGAPTGVAEAASERAPALIVGALGAIVALGPFLLFGGTAGYEVAHPMAVVLTGGLTTATLLSLFVLPVVSSASGRRRSATDADADPSGNGQQAPILVHTGDRP